MLRLRPDMLRFVGSRVHRFASTSQPRSLATKAAEAPKDVRPAELFSIDGRVALVTGGSQGLGKAIARGLALAGASVIVSSRRELELKAALADILDGTGSKGSTIVADLSKPGEAERLGQAALREFGHVDILISNAGVSRPGCVHIGGAADDAPASALPNMTAEDWDTTLATNVTAGVHLVNTLVPEMASRGWGRIVHISSIGGLGSSEGRSAYSASKAAQIAVTNAAALELGPHGITVNAIAPGAFLTEMPLTKLPPATIEAIATKVPNRRWGQPHELVGPILMLVSDAGAYVNGATLRVDGGLLSRAY